MQLHVMPGFNDMASHLLLGAPRRCCRSVESTAALVGVLCAILLLAGCCSGPWRVKWPPQAWDVTGASPDPVHTDGVLPTHVSTGEHGAMGRLGHDAGCTCGR